MSSWSLGPGLEDDSGLQADSLIGWDLKRLWGRNDCVLHIRRMWIVAVRGWKIESHIFNKWMQQLYIDSCDLLQCGFTTL